MKKLIVLLFCMTSLSLYSSCDRNCPQIVRTGVKSCMAGCGLGLVVSSSVNLCGCPPGCAVATGLAATTCCAIVMYKDYKRESAELAGRRKK
jgi:hypothetical protein